MWVITIQANQIMIEHYQEVVHVTSSEIRLRMSEYMLLIKGIQLHVVALSKYEILVEGKMEGLSFLYEVS